MVEISLSNRIGNGEFKRGIGVHNTMTKSPDGRVFRWFCHRVGMEDDRLAKRVWTSKVSGTKRREKPTMTCLDGVERTLDVRELPLSDGRGRALDKFVNYIKCDIFRAPIIVKMPLARH